MSISKHGSQGNVATEQLPEPRRVINIKGQDTPVYEGTIVYILSNSDVGVVKDDVNNQYTFKFDMIPGYIGQTAGTLNLAVGSRVEFALANGEVFYITTPTR